ncbi:hypothetical protein CEXT_104251 [Caerostris extrusa]|uniref:Uncharacterized protein n=1 Tax=Caerostris extrusa TaxID=172846 RepID=A0AAV4SKM2_CAEEX|nr:hypothetical protein CEXT_104251 [Caerostris extrusa]
MQEQGHNKCKNRDTINKRTSTQNKYKNKDSKQMQEQVLKTNTRTKNESKNEVSKRIQERGLKTNPRTWLQQIQEQGYSKYKNKSTANTN